MPTAPLLIANWKMYKTVEESASFARLLVDRLAGWWQPDQVRLAVAPTALALEKISRVLGHGPIALAAQNLDLGTEGARTGALSGYLLHEAGAQMVIVGHSERRRYFHETDDEVADKVGQAWQAGLTPVLCIGETLAERDGGHTEAVLSRQLTAVLAKPWNESQGLVIAYEPVWAIGTGRVADAVDIEQWAVRIQDWVTTATGSAALPILYGGSVNADNLASFLCQPHVNGALVGGASLGLDSWISMVKVAQQVFHDQLTTEKGE